MKKSTSVQITFLASVAFALGGCHRDRPENVYLNEKGQCISEETGLPVEQRICYGSGGGYYGGRHFVYIPYRSAPYYSSPSSPGYVRPWGASPTSPAGTSSGTIRGVFGGGGGGEGGGE